MRARVARDRAGPARSASPPPRPVRETGAASQVSPPPQRGMTGSDRTTRSPTRREEIMFLLLALVLAALVISGVLFVGARMEESLLAEAQPARAR